MQTKLKTTLAQQFAYVLRKMDGEIIVLSRNPDRLVYLMRLQRRLVAQGHRILFNVIPVESAPR